MKLSAVLFDLDGVLIDSGLAWYRVVCRGREHYGRPPVSLDTFRATFGQGVEDDRDQYFPGIAVSEISAFYERAFPDEIGAVQLIDDADSVLAQLGQRGLKRAVVTNTPLPLARQILQQKGLAAHVDVLAASGDGDGETSAADKPAGDLPLLALARLGLAPQDVLYVGDSPSDLGACRAAGLRMVGLGISGDLTIRSLREISP